jgi:CBS domain-containing protein
MKVSDVMTRGAVSVQPETRLRELAHLLNDRGISGVPVVDEEGRCIGVISETDLLVKQLGRSVSRRLPLEWILGDHHDPAEMRRRSATTAGEAMSSPAITIDADRALREAAALMIDRQVNRLPVLEAGQLVGVLTRADLVRAYLRLDAEIEAQVREDVLRRTMWLDPAAYDIDVREGLVRIGGQVDRRSTALIVEKLIGVVDGVVEVQSALTWDLDDSALELPAETEGEPGAASVTTREPRQPVHR